ncbi:MAG: hypothetical protein ACP5UR_07830 [Chloroflexus sp.]|uniref:hypothetical protein n=1 Tax=Chloroflexus sp. TaxID=1904827 RepID=UPI003C750093
MNKSNTVLILISIAFVVVLTACGDTAGVPPPTPTTAESARPTRTPRPAAANTQPTTAPTAASEGTIIRPPPTNNQTGLTTLGNVQVEMSLEGTIKTEGQTDESIRIVMQEIRLQNGNSRLVIESTTPDQGISRISYFLIDGETFQYTERGDERTCISVSGSDFFTGSMLTPESLIGDLKEATLAERGVQVNGFTTDRYTFSLNEQSLGYQGQASGEIWVASSPNIVVRHIGTLNGSFGGIAVEEGGEILPQSTGNLSWKYNVTQIAQTPTITLPETCTQQQAAGADIPLPPNISNQLRTNDMISFEASDTAANIAQFYQTEMVAKGWQAGTVTQYGDTYQLTFTKDGRTATITISTTDNRTQVIIFLGL